MSDQSGCTDGVCVPSRSGGFCLICGQVLAREVVPQHVRDLALTLPAIDATERDPDDPNYWSHFMHDLEVIAVPVTASTNAGLSFYGKRPAR